MNMRFVVGYGTEMGITNECDGQTEVEVGEWS
jgi:hypothetical protein